MKKFAIEFQHNGKTWGVTIPASSFEDAEERLKSIGEGIVLGESGGFTKA